MWSCLPAAGGSRDDACLDALTVSVHHGGNAAVEVRGVRSV